METKIFRKMLFVILILTLTVVLLFADNHSLNARTTQGIETTKYLLMMHQKHMQQLSPAEISAPTKMVDVGNIAVITGDAKTFFPRNPFDLTGKKISFVPNSSGGYNVKVSSGIISGDEGVSIGHAPYRGKKVDFKSGFSFSFYGVSYNSVFVDGCGSLGFQKNAFSFGDPVSVLGGPPLIVPLEASCAAEVKALQTPDKFSVTWRTSAGYRIDTQVNLFKNGTITFLYGEKKYPDDPSLDYGFTGISPGKTDTANLKLVNFSSGSTKKGDAKTAFFEVFRPILLMDPVQLIQEFHQTHPQIFDFVTIFTDQSSESKEYNQGRYFARIQNSIRGIGLGQFNSSVRFGSPQIQGFIMMNSLADFPSDLNAPIEGTYNALQFMAELHGERWLPYARVMINGVRKNDLKGYIEFCFFGSSFAGRWNFFMDTDASVMGGNDITDNGNGTFTTTASTLRYSKLDQYLMGLIPSSAVPSFFLAGTKPALSCFDDFEELGSGSPPQAGITFSGTRVNVNVNQIIQAEGPRVPSSQTSQKEFREAFIYFIRPGSRPDPAQIAKINKIRTMWQSFFKTATNQNGTMNTSLK